MSLANYLQVVSVRCQTCMGWRYIKQSHRGHDSRECLCEDYLTTPGEPDVEIVSITVSNGYPKSVKYFDISGSSYPAAK